MEYSLNLPVHHKQETLIVLFATRKIKLGRDHCGVLSPKSSYSEATDIVATGSWCRCGIDWVAMYNGGSSSTLGRCHSRAHRAADAVHSQISTDIILFYLWKNYLTVSIVLVKVKWGGWRNSFPTKKSSKSVPKCWSNRGTQKKNNEYLRPSFFKSVKKS